MSNYDHETGEAALGADMLSVAERQSAALAKLGDHLLDGWGQRRRRHQRPQLLADARAAPWLALTVSAAAPLQPAGFCRPWCGTLRALRAPVNTSPVAGLPATGLLSAAGASRAAAPPAARASLQARIHRRLLEEIPVPCGPGQRQLVGRLP